MTYYKQCVKGHVDPLPKFVTQIKNNCLRIENDFMSIGTCNALKEMLQQGAKLN